MHLCEICEENAASAKCKLCRRNVCDKHLVLDGICSICKETLCQRCKKYHSIGYCKYCGRILCEDCLIQISPVEYVCIECFSDKEKLKQVNDFVLQLLYFQ